MKSNTFLRGVLITIVLAIIGGYALYESRNLISGPVLKIDEPTNGFSTENSIVEVKGQARNISFISIDDRRITVDEAGWFKEKVLLSLGYNVVKVYVHDKFGRSKEALVELIRKAEKEQLTRK